MAVRQFAGPLLCPSTTFASKPVIMLSKMRKGRPILICKQLGRMRLAARELLAAAIRWGEEIPPDGVIVIDEEKRELLTVFTTEVLPDPIRKRLR
jgi:hypothetical protein